MNIINIIGNIKSDYKTEVFKMKTRAKKQRKDFATKTFTLILILFVLSTSLFAQKNDNLFQNASLTMNGSILQNWGCNHKVSKIIGPNDKNAVKFTISKKAGTSYQLTMVQRLKNLQAGKYRFSAYMKISQEIKQPLLVRIITVNKKNIYQAHMLHPSYLSPGGKWKLISKEFTIPEGVEHALVGFDLRASEAGAIVEISEPVFQKQAKQPIEQLNTEIYPPYLNHNYCSVLPGIPMLLEVSMRGDAMALKGKKIAFELTLPKGVKVVGASHMYPKNGEFPILKTKKITNGKFLIELPKKYVLRLKKNSSSYPKAPLYMIHNKLQIVLAVEDGANPKIGKASFRTLINDKAGKAKQFEIEILPPLATKRKQAKRFDITIASCSEIGNPIAGNQYDSFLSSLSANRMLYLKRFPLYNMSKDFFASCKAKNYKFAIMLGWNHYIGLKFNTCPPNIKAELYIPGSKFMDIGKLIEDKHNFIWHKMFKDTFDFYLSRMGMKSDELTAIFFDYEPSTNYSENVVSAENRKRFAKYASLSSVPTVEQIKAKYEDQWLKFRIDQSTAGGKQFAQAVKRYNPKLEALLCTTPLFSYPPFRVHPNCPVDPLAIEKYIDGIDNMFYANSKRVLEMIIANMELSKPKRLVIDPSERLEDFYSRYTPKGIKQSIISAAAFGYRGVAFWPDFNLDGKYLKNIAEAYNAIAHVENFYFHKQNNARLHVELLNQLGLIVKDGRVEFGKVISSDNVKIFLHEDDGQYVITALNYNRNLDIIAKAKIRNWRRARGKSRIHVTDVVSMLGYPGVNPGKGFLFRIPANGVAVFKIGQRVENTIGTVSQTNIRHQLASQKQSSDSFVDLKGQDKHLQYVLAPSTNKLMILAKNKAGKILVNSQTAAICSWQPKDKKDLLISEKCGDIVFHTHRLEMPPLHFKFDSFKYKGESIELNFSATMRPFLTATPTANPILGLKFKRTIIFDNNKIKVVTQLTNPNQSQKAMAIELRFKNIIFPGQNIISVLAPHKLYAENLLLKIKDAHALPFKVKSQTWKNAPIIVQAANGDTLTFTFSDNYSDILLWRQGATTVEPIPVAKMLKPGNSIVYWTQLFYKPSTQQ